MHHELHQPVVGVPVAPHQVQRQPVRAPGHEAEQRAQLAVARRVHSSITHCPSRGVAEPAERHREAALGRPVAPVVGPPQQVGHLVGRDVLVAADRAPCSRPA